MKLSWLNNSLQFLQKQNFSERQISVMSLSDQSYNFFCSRWASFPNQPSRVVSTRLVIYNSKSSKPNGSASTFRRRLSYAEDLFVKAPTQLAQWLNPLLVAVFAKILFLTAKMSSLVEPLLRVATVASLVPLKHVFLFPLLHLLLLRLLFLAPSTLP